MSAKLSKCFRCGSTDIQERLVEEFVRQGQYVVALRLSADVCSNCERSGISIAAMPRRSKTSGAASRATTLRASGSRASSSSRSERRARLGHRISRRRLKVASRGSADLRSARLLRIGPQTVWKSQNVQLSATGGKTPATTRLSRVVRTVVSVSSTSEVSHGAQGESCRGLGRGHRLDSCELKGLEG